MVKEQEIKEVREIADVLIDNKGQMLIEVAIALYNAGYRKHRTGRWVHNEGGSAYQPPYFCSECLADGDYDGDNPFCWNCGAKMKGGSK